MLIKGNHYSIYNIDAGTIDRLWMPVKGGLNTPTRTYLDSLKPLQRQGLYTLAPGQMAGGSGGFGGGSGASGTNSFVINIDADTNTNAPTDATTYFLGMVDGLTATNSGRIVKVLPVAATLTKSYWMIWISTTAASGETVNHYASKNQHSTPADSDSAAFAWSTAAPSVQTGNATITTNGSYSAGDSISAKIVTPTWVTNPIDVRAHAAFYFTVP